LIETLPVFDGPRDSLAWHERAANTIRVTTRPWIVRRELLFGAGQVYDSARIAETERNLRGLGVFRRVEIDSFRVDGHLAVRVRTGDGWSTRPQLGFRSAGTDFVLTAGISEQNFLGTATSARVYYRHNPDRDAIQLGLRNPHTLGLTVETDVEYEKLSDGERGAVQIRPHHVALSAKGSFALEGELGTTTQLQFREAALAATFRRRLGYARGAIAWALHANSSGYVHLLLTAQLRREDIVPDTIAGFSRTVTGAVGTGVEFRHARFLVTERYNSFGHREDVDLSTVIRAEWRVAPSAWGYDRTTSGPAVHLQTGGMWKGGFFRIALAGHALLAGAAVDSGAVVASGTAVFRLLPRHTLILAGRVGAQKNPIPGEEFDLGLGEGPRGFGIHAFTGTRMGWATLEHRAFLVDDWLNILGLGVAVFGDYGGAWFAGERQRVGGNVGFGLRLGSPRSAHGSMARVDLAYRFGEGAGDRRWVLVLGRSQSF
jgi:hypothetical protein